MPENFRHTLSFFRGIYEALSLVLLAAFMARTARTLAIVVRTTRTLTAFAVFATRTTRALLPALGLLFQNAVGEAELASLFVDFKELHLNRVALFQSHLLDGL